MIPQSRRVKRFMVGADTILDMVLRGFGVVTPGYVQILDAVPFPPGSRLLGVDYSWPHQSFGFMVEHEEFPEVPDGAMAPDVCGPFGAAYRSVRVLDDSPPATGFVDSGPDEGPYYTRDFRRPNGDGPG